MVKAELRKRYQRVSDSCRLRLSGHPRLSMTEQLAGIAKQANNYPRQDYYGEGELISCFEAEIADLLGKEAALFLPSGTMAQNIALKIWADRADCQRVGFHASSHLELHEENASRALYGLDRVLLGEENKPVTLANLEAVDEQLAAVLLELPMREIGGQLPRWDELQRQHQWSRDHGVALHMDGARLWQCTPYYQRSMADIAALFDSVYLSFYKDMGGIAGSTLAGSEEFIACARTWLRRAGGNLFSQFPYVLAARAGMERNFSAIPRAVGAAAWLAGFFNTVDGLETLPEVPPTNLFHLRVPAAPDQLVRQACDWSEAHGVFLLPMPRAVDGDYSIVEYSLGQAVEATDRGQWQNWIADFFSTLS